MQRQVGGFDLISCQLLSLLTHSRLIIGRHVALHREHMNDIRLRHAFSPASMGLLVMGLYELRITL